MVEPTRDKVKPWASSADETSASWLNNLPLGNRDRNNRGGFKRGRFQGGRQWDTEAKVTFGAGGWSDQQVRKERQATSGAVGWDGNLPVSTPSWGVDGSWDTDSKKHDVSEQEWDEGTRAGAPEWESSKPQQAKPVSEGGWNTGRTTQVQSNRGWDDSAAEGAEEIEW